MLVDQIFLCKISIGEQIYSSGVIAIVVLGLILSNHRTAISSEATIFMEKYVILNSVL